MKPIIIDPKTFLVNHCTLPALPAVLTDIQKAVNAEVLNAKKIGNIISSDPGLVAQILKIVNSAYYGLRKELKDINFAVAYLGISEVYRITLSISVINSLGITRKKELEAIWSHSLMTALCSKYLAKKFEKSINTDELWTAAILHDVGKLVYLKYFPDHYDKISSFSKTNDCLFNEAELELGFPASSYLGSLLCDRWRLPSLIKNTCTKHTLIDLYEFTEGKLILPVERIVTLGNLFSILLIEQHGKEKKDQIMTAITDNLEIVESEFWLIMGDLSELKSELKTFH